MYNEAILLKRCLYLFPNVRLCECETWGREADIQQAEDRFYTAWEDKPPGSVQQSAMHESGEGHPAEANNTIISTENTADGHLCLYVFDWISCS